MSWAAVGAAAVTVVGNELMSDDGGGGNTTVQAQQTQANPFTAGGGLFSTSFGPGVVPGGGQSIANLTPEQQTQLAQLRTLQNQKIQTPTGNVTRQSLAKQGVFGRDAQDMLNKARNSGNSGPSFTTSTRGLQPGDLEGIDPAVLAVLNQQDSQGGGLGLDMSITDPRLNTINQQGLEGAGIFFDQSINNENAALAGQVGNQFLSQLQQTDPMDIAQSQFNLLNPILQRQQEEEFLGLESRLFQQGRMGSGGSLSGQNDLNALFDSQSDAERKLLFDSLGQGMAVQNQQASIAAIMAQLDPSLRAQFQGLGTGALQVPLQIQQAMLSQAQVAGGLSGANTVGSLTPPGFSATNAVGAGLLNQGVQGLTNSIPGLFQSNTALIDRPTVQPGQFDSGPFPGTAGR